MRLVFTAIPLLFALCRAGSAQQDPPATPPPAKSGITSNGFSSLFNYLSMAGSQTVADFRPMTQRERTEAFKKSLVNPWFFLKGVTSGAIDQRNDKPEEWGQGFGA